MDIGVGNIIIINAGDDDYLDDRNDDQDDRDDHDDCDNRVAHQLIGASLPSKTGDGNYVPHLLIQHVGKECLEVFGEHTAFAINFFSLCATTNVIFPGATTNAEHLDCPEVREHVHLKAAHNPEGQIYFLLDIFYQTTHNPEGKKYFLLNICLKISIGQREYSILMVRKYLLLNISHKTASEHRSVGISKVQGRQTSRSHSDTMRGCDFLLDGVR